MFFLTSKRELKTGLWVQYAMTLLFGTIHGMGFFEQPKATFGWRQLPFIKFILL